MYSLLISQQLFKLSHARLSVAGQGAKKAKTRAWGQNHHTSLHEESVCRVELPRLVLTTEICALLQDGLHLTVVLHVPVDARLAHQHCTHHHS